MIADVFDSGEMVKIVDALLDEPGRMFNKTELADNAEVSRPTVYKLLPNLEALGIIAGAGRADGIDLYRLNTNSALVRSLLRFDNELAKMMFRVGISTPDSHELEQDPHLSALRARAADWAEILGLELPHEMPSGPCGILVAPSTGPMVTVCRERGKRILAAVPA